MEVVLYSPYRKWWYGLISYILASVGRISTKKMIIISVEAFLYNVTLLDQDWVFMRPSQYKIPHYVSNVIYMVLLYKPIIFYSTLKIVHLLFPPVP
jgi:hypothetical protein